jgi:hypothetical protein
LGRKKHGSGKFLKSGGTGISQKELCTHKIRAYINFATTTRLRKKRSSKCFESIGKA